MSNTLRIKAGEIDVGKPLVWDVYDREGVLLLHRGNIIGTATQLNILMERGIYHVAVRSSEGSRPHKNESQEEVSPFHLIDRVYSRLENIIFSSTPEAEKELPVNISSLCRLLQRACVLDADATLSTISLELDRRYSIKHSIDVAIICELIGDAMGMPVNERLSLIAGALTENIAIAPLMDVLQSQDALLNDEQRKKIHEHPARGMEIQRSSGVNDHIWIDAVLKHHESANGKGYPAGLKGEAVSAYAHLIAISDFYCAKITGRSYRPPLSSHKAMQFIFPAGDSRIDANLAEVFVKTLGIYLPGTFAYLKNNQIAVVTNRGEKIHSPIVQVVTGRDGMPLPGPLSQDTSDHRFSIMRVIPPGEVSVKVNRYQLWGYPI
ncbi:MAG: HD domain-containing protein [Syntrophales bacterium LBB04]|nr:HD domain-containing protein [Syntrophales bacterium LBB04]